MTKWKIILSKSGEKELNKLSPNTQESILDYLYNRILTLEHPKQLGKALSRDKKGLWRYRVDKFRIICKLEEETLVILVVKIAKRDVVYEN